jgi:hypothetical protein
MMPEDPEFSEIKIDGSIRQFEKSFEAAATKKAARLNTPPEARLTGGAGKVTPATPATLIDQYKQEMLANRGKGMDVGNAIKSKYREKGVNVDTISLMR